MDLPVVFSRAARRAGLVQEFTQGFSPHPRMSLASPLAIGVEGLAEPAEFWFDEWNEQSMNRWNEKLPEGLKILKWAEADGPALAKLADTAVYRISGAGKVLPEQAKEVLSASAEELNALRSCEYKDGVITLTAGDPEHFGAGRFVKALSAAGVVEGWEELSITRLLSGQWQAESKTVRPLI